MGNDEKPDMTKAHNKYGQLMPCLQRCELQSETLLLTSAKYPSKEVFSFRKDYCFVLLKLAKVCNQTSRRKIFESSYKQVSCESIIKMNSSKDLCNENFVPNATTVMANSAISSFIFDYAQNNLIDLTVFIKDPFYTR